MVEFSDEEYDSICSTVAGEGCSKEAACTDALGLTWCQDCKQRGDLVNWGASHGYRALEIEPYATAEGAYFYHVAATCGSDEMVWMMIGLTEMLDNQREVA
jgi:hypothetical protein